MTVNYALLRKAVLNFPVHGMTDRCAVKAMRRKWIQSILMLGDDWLLKKPVKRITRKRRVI